MEDIPFSKAIAYKTASYIWVTFQKEGIHNYPEAPDEVAFLRTPHRHIFHFKVYIEVFNDNRDIEFIILKRELESLYSQKILQLDNKSCEMIANELLRFLFNRYPDRNMSVEVSEDGENGASVLWEPVL